MTNISFPKAFKPLFQPKRYKIYKGGRGGAKSWNFARALLLLGAQETKRILCTREFQASLDESVHKLLADQISLMGLDSFYEVQRSKIYGKNGTEFIFEGLRHNIKSIKSIEGVDICWVEEAQSVSKESWDILIPTIRKQDSEIWISFNPDLEEDETYDRFVTHQPEQSVLMHVNYTDNPHCPQTLIDEAEACLKRSQQEYDHIWLGKCVQYLDGTYYAEYMQKAESEGRVDNLPIDPMLKVNTAWDIGMSDDTAIIFFQHSPAGQIRIIDYHESRGVGLEHYARVISEKQAQYGWIYDYHLLPHDIEVRELGTGKSRFETLQGLGIQPTIVPRLAVADGINAVRRAFPAMWFDKTKAEFLIRSIKRYRREFDDKRNVFYDKPRHDEHSHAADALRYLAVGIQERTKATRPMSRGLSRLA